MDVRSLDRVRFVEPWSLGGTHDRADVEVLAALSRLLQSGTNERSTRAASGLEWFRLAHTEVDEVTPLNTVVMMATAFETLLGLSKEYGKARSILNLVHERLETTQSYETRLLTNANGKSADVTRVKAAWWAYDFYGLRNSIAHGDVVPPERLAFTLDGEGISQLDVADALIGELLIWELESEGFLGTKVNEFLEDVRKLQDPPLIGPVTRGTWASAIRFVHDLTDIQRRLGWIKAGPGPFLEDNEGPHGDVDLDSDGGTLAV